MTIQKSALLAVAVLLGTIGAAITLRCRTFSGCSRARGGAEAKMVGKTMKCRSAITLIVAGSLLLCGAGLTAAGNFSSRHDNTSAAGSNLVPKASNSAMTDYLPL